jgi:hypothetical protein
VSAAFLTAGALVLLRGRPLLLRGRLLAWLVAAVVLPIILAILVMIFAISESGVVCIGLIPASLLALMPLVVRRSLRGYALLAVTEHSFRKSVRESLSDLGLPFEETLLGVVLSSLHDTLQARIEPRLGMAQLRMKSGDEQVLEQVAARVRHHLQSDVQSASLGSAGIFVAIGLLALALAGYQAGRF